MAEHRLRDAKRRDAVQVEYYANHAELMKPKIFGDRLAQIYAERNVPVKYQHRLASVDTAAQKAVFEILPAPSEAPVPPEATYERVTVDFDFLHRAMQLTLVVFRALYASG
jgi:sulfide:quinone oxidoreductase